MWGLTPFSHREAKGKHNGIHPPSWSRWTVQHSRKGIVMLLAIAGVLLILWLLGLLISYTLGGFIHIFLVIALVVLVAHIFRSRRKPA
jgi:hypothetical protein